MCHCFVGRLAVSLEEGFSRINEWIRCEFDKCLLFKLRVCCYFNFLQFLEV